MRCRPGTVPNTAFGTVPDQRRTATRCTASGTRDRLLRIQPDERRLHLTADANRGIIRIVFDIRPFQALALAEVALELHVLRETQRQQPARERQLGRRLLAPDAEPTLAVEHLAGLEIALGGRGDVRAEP